MERKVKNFGQVFTPPSVVGLILDYAGYRTENAEAVLKKHVLDNSCGDGAFLCEIVRRYCQCYYANLTVGERADVNQLKDDLSCFIHGIEIQKEAYDACLINLDQTAAEFHLTGVQWNVYCEDALKTRRFDGRMDYVVGNPPYVRVHHLENYDVVKSYEFSKGGMTDLFLVFFEIGLKMLKGNGVMCMITPVSWLYSKAGSGLRHYLTKEKTLYGLIDFGHFQAFDCTTYTIISKIVKGVSFETVDYKTYNGRLHDVARLSYEEICFDDRFFLETPSKLKRIKEIRSVDLKKAPQVCVKNGFATLADKVFVGDFGFKEGTIEILKASTGKWSRCIFPYDENGKPLDWDSMEEQYPSVCDYLIQHKERLEKKDGDSYWYLFGRTQAVGDVLKRKIAINPLVKDVDSIKLNEVEAGKGLYSGLYIITDVSFERIREILANEDFISYLASLKNYKSGGYYTFSSRDLALYLSYFI